MPRRVGGQGLLILTHGGSALMTFGCCAAVMALVIGYQIAGIVGMVIAVPTAVLIAEFTVDRRDRLERH